MANGTLEIVSFEIGGQKFCIDIMAIREIRGWVPVTPIPHAPAHVLGILNLRGAVIPVIDLAVRLGMAPIETSERSGIIVTEVNGMIAGLLVEQVSDMVTVNESDLQPPPAVIPERQRNFCHGVIAQAKDIICFLNLAALGADGKTDPAEANEVDLTTLAA